MMMLMRIRIFLWGKVTKFFCAKEKFTRISDISDDVSCQNLQKKKKISMLILIYHQMQSQILQVREIFSNEYLP